MNASDFALIDAIDTGAARKIKAASFRDGDEDQFVVEFYALEGRVYRLCYNAHSTCTEVSEVWGEDRELFDLHYGEG